MSVITAIFQAIFQAICWVIPISESGHSAMFHDFSNRFSGACSALTGVIHIGIAIGIIIAIYKFVFKMAKELFATTSDLFKKKLKVNEQTPIRHYLYMNLMSYLPMLLWLIPCGKKGLLFNVLRSTQFNSTLLDDGLFMALTGGLLFYTVIHMSKGNISKEVPEIASIVVGASSVLLIPVSGFAFIGVVFSILILFGVSKKLAINYGMLMSIPVLVVMGIVEICISVTSVSIVSIILGLIISAFVAFVCVRLFSFIVNKGYLKFVGIYDIAVGVIIFIVGIFELIFR